VRNTRLRSMLIALTLVTGKQTVSCVCNKRSAIHTVHAYFITLAPQSQLMTSASVTID